MKIILVISLSYLSAVVVLSVLTLFYRSKQGKKFLISQDPKRAKSKKDLYYSAFLNSTVSMAFIFIIFYAFSDYFLHEQPISISRFALESVGVILIYDFGYYAMHRYLFHGWKPLKRVHAVHHSVKHPRVIDSLMLHPVETVMGLSLFFGTVALVGGVHLYTLATLFTTYTAFMVLNHAGVNCKFFPFKTLGMLAAKHDQHHHSMNHGNYAAITPLPDIIFRTVEKR